MRGELNKYKKIVLKIKDDLRDYFIQLEDTALDVLQLSVDQYESFMKPSEDLHDTISEAVKEV